MTRILLSAICLLALGAGIPAFPCPQDTLQSPTRTKGAIFKEQIDQLVAALHQRAMKSGNAPLGGDSVRTTAIILTAMGHCHRHYHISDGPVVKPSIDLLFKNRRADGSFGQEGESDVVSTTAWVCEALAVMNPDGFRSEIDQGLAWVRRNHNSGAYWRSTTAAILAEVRSDRFPQQLGAEAADTAQTLATAGELDLPAAAATLLRLVACQTANRQLDRVQNAPATVFSPAQQKGFDFLAGKQKDGIFFVKAGPKEFPDPGFTALGLAAMQTKPKTLRTKGEQELLEKGLRWLVAAQNEDGSFGQHNVNYVTCAVVMALSRWDNPELKPVMMKAQAYVLAIQNTEQNGYQSGDRDYGSIGYGGDQRGDLSNLQFALEALRLTDLQADHEALAKALVFLQRTQNLRSVNDFTGKVPDDDGNLMQVTSGDDGGSAYYPGNSPAGYVDLPDGSRIPRSYGSMTYALLKAYTLAGLKGDDPRVQAAVKWIEKHWTLAENPGADPVLGEKAKYQGLFYYYMVVGQALETVGIDQLQVPGADDKTTPVNWRKALRAHLEGMQRADGSWLNERNDRWYEGMDVLCTCYAMLGLERCR